VTDHVVVTGASSGIGAACVTLLQDGGFSVVGVDLAASSGADVHVVADLSRPDCGETIASACEGKRVVGLINAAAFGEDVPARKVTPDHFDRMMATNVRGPLLIAVALHPALAAAEGWIVNIASVHAVATSSGVPTYAASKGALVAMSRELAIEWAPQVRVNAVLPGAIDTTMLREGLRRTGTSNEDLAGRHLLGRVGEADDVAEVVLAVARSKFMTGGSVIVDGGATAMLSTESDAGIRSLPQ